MLSPVLALLTSLSAEVVSVASVVIIVGASNAVDCIGVSVLWLVQ